MCNDHDIPLIEFHSLTGEVCGIRRDLIVSVVGNSPMGSRVGSSFGALEVIEPPAEVLALIRGEKPDVVTVRDWDGNVVVRATDDGTCPECGHFHTRPAGPFGGICVGCQCDRRGDS